MADKGYPGKVKGNNETHLKNTWVNRIKPSILTTFVIPLSLKVKFSIGIGTCFFFVFFYNVFLGKV